MDLEKTEIEELIKNYIKRNLRFKRVPKTLLCSEIVEVYIDNEYVDSFSIYNNPLGDD